MSETDRAQVELRVPAEGAFASVLRTTAAGLAARVDFTLDDIEDLRMAVSEAAAIVLEQADPGSVLDCRFVLDPGRLSLRLGVESAAAVLDLDSFAWQVLTTLAAAADVETAEGRFTVTLDLASSAGAGA